MNLSLTIAAAVVVSADSSVVVRVNQVGYLPDAPKIAVACSLVDTDSKSRPFIVRGESGKVVLGPMRVRGAGTFGPCKMTWRLSFSAVRTPGRYVIEFSGASAHVR